MIALQGPKVLEACGKFFKFDANRLKYYHSVITEHLKKPVIVSRTGYTGEDGIELIVRAEDAPRVWENMLLAGRDAGFIAAGLGARDTLRTEAGMPLYGHELSDSITPIEAGLKFACNLDGREFLGSEAIRKIADEGPSRVRIGLTPDTKRVVRDGAAVLNQAKEKIGEVTSGCPSPTLGHSIAMAYVASANAGDETVLVDLRGELVPARITPLPFYQRSR